MLIDRLPNRCLGPLLATLLWLVPAAASPPPPADDLANRAAALLAEQGALLREGKREELLAAVDETIALHEALGDRHGQATALTLRALARWGAGGGEATVADLEAALELLEQADDPLGAWLMLWALAEAESQEGRLESADRRLRRALDLLAEVRSSPEPLDFQGLTRLCGFLGTPLQAFPDLGPAAAFVKPILVAFLEIPVRESLVGVAIDRERLDEAEEELERASQAAALFGGLFDAALHRRRGDLHRRRWRLDLALQSYQKALEAPSLVGLVSFASEDPFAFQVLDRLAEVESLAGRPAAALAWNDRALTLAREGENRRREAMVMEDRAALHLRHGDLEQARALLEQAEAIARDLGDDYRLASVLGELGNLAFRSASYQEAAAYLERSAALLQRLGEPYVAAPTLLLLAESYQMLEAHGRTDEILRRAEEQARSSGFREAESLAASLKLWNRFVAGEASTEQVRQSLQELLAVASPQIGPFLRDTLLLDVLTFTAEEEDAAEEVARQLLAAEAAPLEQALARLALGVSQWRRGELETAEDELRRAAHGLEAVGQLDLAGTVRAALAGLYHRSGRLDLAADELDRAVTNLETVLGGVQVEELMASFLGGGRGLIYRLLVDLQAAAGRPREAFLQAERARSRALLRLLGNQRLRPPTGTDPALVESANALRLRIDEWERELLEPFDTRIPEARQKLEHDLEHARRSYEDLMVRLKVQSPEYASLASVDPLPAEAVQAALEPGVTLISYFLTPTGGYAWLIERQRFQQVTLPWVAADLQDLTCWVREVGRPAAPAADGPRGATMLDGCAPDPERAERLYRKLVAPLAPASLAPKLVIVPHGPLHYLPFAALRDPERARLLIEDFELTLAPSASVVPFLRDKESPVEAGALVLGAPATADRALPALAGAQEEARAAADFFGVAPRLGPSATEESVHAAAGGIDLLHLAAHGVNLPENPRFSHILLAPGGGRDGKLEVREVFGDLDLSGVNLVVLSACQTAIGPDAGGDEIVSLTRAFLYAGSPGVLSTLWAVPDRPSAHLVEAFYRRLVAGEKAAAALRGAQLEMLRTDRAHPYFWAGYTLTGDPRGRWSEGAQRRWRTAR